MLHTAAEASKMLAERALEICRYLLPDGRMVSGRWCVGDVNGNRGDSLKVELVGEHAGRWRDWADDSVPGGDLLDLWAAVRRVDLATALPEALQWLGLGDGSQIRPMAKKSYKTPQTRREDPSDRLLGWFERERRLKSETVLAYMVGLSGHKIAFPRYSADGSDRVVASKLMTPRRNPGEHNFWISDGDAPSLFGWQVVPSDAQTVVICEGEIDAMTVFQETGLPALSVPMGAGNPQWIDYDWERLSGIRDIVLCFDSDDAGQKGLEKALERLGAENVRIVVLPPGAKDPNELLCAGRADELRAAVAKAKGRTPRELRELSELVHDAVGLITENKAKGLTIPWAQDLDLRINEHDLVLLNGYNGHGKTQMAFQLVCSLVNQGAKACLYSGELDGARIAQRFLRLGACCGNYPHPEDETAVMAWLEGRVYFVDVAERMPYKQLLELFAYAYRRFGCDLFLIDSMMMLANVEDYQQQAEMISDICTFKQKYPVRVLLVVHPRKPPNEKGPRQKPDRYDIKGTSVTSDKADTVLTISRGHGEEPTQLICDKDRLHGSTFTREIFYDVRGQQFKLAQTDPPVKYAEMFYDEP